MKFIILGLLTGLIFVLIFVVLARRAIDQAINERNKGPSYIIRFNPSKNKYYVVDERNTKDIPFRTTLGFIKYYDSRNQAEVILQKLKGNFQ